MSKEKKSSKNIFLNLDHLSACRASHPRFPRTEA